MRSFPPLRRDKAHKHFTDASFSRTPGLRWEIPNGRGRTAKLRNCGLVSLLALSALVLLPAGTMAQAQEISSLHPSGSESDVLTPGVPADVTGTALRRAWSSDPAIRDFIGLSEDSWDFNAPGGAPGFGPLNTDDSRRLLARMTGEAEGSVAESPAAERTTTEQVPIATVEARQAPSSAPVK